MTRRQRNSYFQCQQFCIEQSGAAMKVTTDACVLGAWAPLDAAGRILDIGTGTGLLALFAAQRSTAQIDAVELDPQAAEQARANFAASPWPERLQLIERDILQFQPLQRYDRILCNPPFFTRSTRNACDRLAQARHDDALPLSALFGAIADLLTPHGEAYLLLPLTAADSALAAIDASGLHLCRRLTLHNAEQDPAHRVILGCSRQPTACREESLTLYTTHPIHTAAAGRLFAPFYARLRCEDPIPIPSDTAISPSDI